MTKTAVVTGSSGFVGRHFVHHLLDAGWEVTSVEYTAGYEVAEFVVDAAVEVRYDLIIHAAAAAPHRAAIDAQHANFPYNVALDAMMFEWAMRTEQGRFVYLSSAAIYSDVLGGFELPFREREGYFYEPFDVYGKTKRMGETLALHAHKHGLPVTIVRPFSGYGEDQSIHFPFGAFAMRAKAKADPFRIWGSARQLRDWIHIDDVVKGTMALIDANVTGPTNLCTGVGTDMETLARMMCYAAGYEPKIHVDEAEPMGVFYRVGDPSQLHAHYTPKITIEEGVRRAFAG